MTDYELCVTANGTMATLPPDLIDDHDLREGSFLIVEVTAVDHQVAESLKDLRGGTS